MRRLSDLELLERGYRQLLWLSAEAIARAPKERRLYLMEIEYPATLMPRLFIDLKLFVDHIVHETPAPTPLRSAA